MITILIVDDSPTETMILKNIFESDPDLQVIGTAKNGREALTLVEKLKPNIITMDIQMPVMDGLEATRTIMRNYPTPIIVISSKLDNKEVNTTFTALEAGALSVLEKPKEIASGRFATEKKKIINTLKAMAEIKVIRRRTFTHPVKKAVEIPKPFQHRYEIIAIGSSVGGPQALKTIITELPSDLSVPIVIVQHMTNGFIDGFAKWLNDNSKLTIKSAENNESLKPGTIYFAPDHFHLKVTKHNNELKLNLSKGDAVSGFCPSITVLFQSVAEIFGEKAIGILLTGMGNDGASGMLELKKAKAHTLIQDKESTVVFGMASVAQSMGAVDKVVELDQFAEYLTKILSS